MYTPFYISYCIIKQWTEETQNVATLGLNVMQKKLYLDYFDRYCDCDTSQHFSGNGYFLHLIFTENNIKNIFAGVYNTKHACSLMSGEHDL